MIHNYAWGSKFPLLRKSLPAKINSLLAIKSHAKIRCLPAQGIFEKNDGKSIG